MSKSLIKKTAFAAGMLLLFTGTLCADGLSLEPGIYDDTHQIILIADSSVSAKVWKTFNTFWYDGPNTFSPAAAENSPIAQIDDGLYLDFCIRYGTGSDVAGVWLPGGNCRELSINDGRDVPARKTRLSGWYISDSGDVWRIPYWQVDADYSPDETAWFFVGEELQENRITVQKKVLVGGIVYTCTTGRSSLIRNPERVDSSVLAGARLSSEATVLSFSDPVYTRISENPDDLDELITRRNTTVYPPRFLWISPREPAIYGRIEQMPPHLD